MGRRRTTKRIAPDVIGLSVQLELPLKAARAAGERGAALCAEKAARVSDFDVAGAARFVLGYLARHGATPGEQIVDAAIAHGHRVHDARAFGSVFRMLSVRKQIRTIGWCERVKGHATAGGRVWALTK
jgi:hypothetical protein